MNQMSNRRELTIDQRRAKNERDRRPRREHKLEVEKLRNLVDELQALLTTQRNENRFVTEENERLNGKMLYLKDTIRQLHEHERELEEQNRGLQETMNIADSYLALDLFRSPNEEVANNETIITHGPESTQSTIRYADELVEDFTKKLDAKEKSNLEFSDFDDWRRS
ncbi:uncharacterized protein LOC111290012 [Durio zibethinus]|uniref:Uncharacterized protein LOC111290012 n=1 Tax=Durio zibethinus TaxID=66656 RepID=A0A6P5Y9I1_DURZI|nr:uncharacterized protein LOC111290012 [Durio zibethinus]